MTSNKLNLTACRYDVVYIDSSNISETLRSVSCLKINKFGPSAYRYCSVHYVDS